MSLILITFLAISTLLVKHNNQLTTNNISDNYSLSDEDAYDEIVLNTIHFSAGTKISVLNKSFEIHRQFVKDDKQVVSRNVKGGNPCGRRPFCSSKEVSQEGYGCCQAFHHVSSSVLSTIF